MFAAGCAAVWEHPHHVPCTNGNTYIVHPPEQKMITNTDAFNGGPYRGSVEIPLHVSGAILLLLLMGVLLKGRGKCCSPRGPRRPRLMRATTSVRGGVCPPAPLPGFQAVHLGTREHVVVLLYRAAVCWGGVASGGWWEVGGRGPSGKG